MHLQTFITTQPSTVAINPVRESLSQADFDQLVTHYKQAFYERAAQERSLMASIKRMKLV